MNPLTSASLILAGCLFSQTSLGETPTSVFKGTGIPSLGSYEPQRPKSLGDFPAPIRDAVEKHLRDRLGTTFRETLQYSSGHIIDSDELHRVDPSSIGFRWEVPAYQISFLVKQPHKEIEYHASVELRKDGTILKEIDLPAVAKFPERGKLVSLHEALETARKKGIQTDDCEAQLEYLNHAGIIVFEIRQHLGKTGSIHHIRRVRIDAHTGAFIDTADLTADG